MKRLLACLLAVLLGLSALIGCAEEPAGDENIVYANGLELTPDEDKTYYTVSGIGTFSGGALNIPAEHEGLPITTIGKSAFEQCDTITSLTIAEGVTTIEERAFSYCTAMTSVLLTASVTSMGKNAFSCCFALTDFRFAEGTQLTVIPDYAFVYCKVLTEITIPQSVVEIGGYAFAGCIALTKVNLSLTDGWRAQGEPISAEDMASPETLAQYLTDTYYEKDFKRKVEPSEGQSDTQA